MKHTIEFIYYDGRYPNLCRGLLVVNIDGKEYNFGIKGINKTDKQLYPDFWISTGGLEFLDDGDMAPVEGNWELSINKNNLSSYPKEIRDVDIFDELIKLMNENVTLPCCGGCI